MSPVDVIAQAIRASAFCTCIPAAPLAEEIVAALEAAGWHLVDDLDKFVVDEHTLTGGQP